MNELPIDVFHKGWTDADLFAKFRKAVTQGDCYTIARTVEAQGADRKPVDAYINAMRLPRQPSGRMPPVTEVMTEERRAELHLIKELADMRDAKLTSLPDDLPLGMRELSFFLEDEKVPRYAKGKDFITTQRTYDQEMAGKSVKKITAGPVKNIVTLRDAASYVHSDDPFALWSKVANYLLMVGVPQRLPAKLNDSDGVGQSRFVCFGAPCIVGLLGYAIAMAGPVSFYNKWYAMVPRPGQLYYEWLNDFLPQAYPEGSPMHPAYPAMHSFVALVCYFFLLEFFDGLTELPHGRTVAAELRLLADNVGYFRVHAAVHYPSDHDNAVELARKVAQDLAAPFLR